jgi:sn-glycerol 3-phosphate transport system permease protein
MSIIDDRENEATRLQVPVLEESAGVAAEILPTTYHPVKTVLKKSQHLKWRRRELGWALLYMSPALAIFILFTYWPFLRSIWLSFFVTDPTGEPVRFNDVKYYSRILNLDGSGRDEYLKSILTTVYFSLMVVPLGIIASVGLAVLATAKVRAIGIFRTIFTSTVAISVASAGVIWALIYNPTVKVTTWLLDALQLKEPGLLLSSVTALPAMAFMTIWTALGFNFIITLAGIQAIPQELYESGKIDGASGWRSFWHITLPLLTPTLLFLLVINIIQCFQSFTQFNILIGNEGPDNSTNVFVYALYKAFWGDNRYGFASAMSVVLFVILLALTVIQFKALDRKVHYQ